MSGTTEAADRYRKSKPVLALMSAGGIIGAIIGGPKGALIGGIAGGLTGAAVAENTE